MFKNENYPCPVSVIMPVYNAGKFVCEAISSILRQTFAGFEFIIIDDGSTDDSWDIIQSFSDDRIITVRNEINMGTFPSRNRGINISKGKYIAVMDADDVALPDRLMKQYDYMENNPEVLATGAQLNFLGTGSKTEMPVSYHEIQAGLLDNSCIMHPTLFIRSGVIKQLGGYDEQYRYASDYDLACRASLMGKIENLPDICVTYRLHPGQITQAKRTEQKGYADIIRQKYQIAFINKYKSPEIPEAGEAETGHPEMGRVIGLYVMGECFNPSFQEQADRLLNYITYKLDSSVPLRIKKGLLGFGSGAMYLLRNHFLEGDENEVLENIDEAVFTATMNYEYNQDFDREDAFYYLGKRASMPNSEHLPTQLRIKKAITQLLETGENNKKNER